MRHGESEPKGYLQWHHWAEMMIAKGHKQVQCKCCGLWFFQWGSTKHKPEAENV